MPPEHPSFGQAFAPLEGGLYKLTTSFPYVINRVGVRMGELFSQHLVAYGITLPMYRVLAALSERAPQRLSDLADMTSVELSTLSRLVGTMANLSLVTRSRVASNTRTVSISLTPKGRSMADELIPMAQHYENVAVTGFSDAEMKKLTAQLERVYRNLDKLDDDAPTPVIPAEAKRRAGT